MAEPLPRISEALPAVAGAPPGAEPRVTEAVSGLGIAAVERETGIRKETLRVWERRYGFPTPARDAGGERLYPLEQVRRLSLLKRLLDAGHRPGRVVPAADEALQALVGVPAALAGTGAPALAEAAPEWAPCIDSLRTHDVEGLRRALVQAVSKRGLEAAVIGYFAPLTRLVGDLWMQGELQIFEEHIYSEALQQVLRQAIQALPSPRQAGSPRVLLTTLPGEQHALGLLMAEALLALEGCACLSLGVQTPVEQLPAAVAAYAADVVALSFSGYLSPRLVLEGLAGLQRQLSGSVEVWAGGSTRALRQRPSIPGVSNLVVLSDVGPRVAEWRRAHPPHGPTGS